MKTDKEMTQDILNHVKTIKREKNIMKKRMYKLTALSCAFALIFIAAFAFFNTDIDLLPDNSNLTDISTENSDRLLNRSFFVMVANAADDTETIIRKEADVRIPLGGILIVEDTKEMSDSDKDAVVLKLKEKLFKLYGKDNGWHLVGTQEETTIYFGTADYLKLMIEESDNVENIIISCTENGKLSISDRSIISSPSKYIETVKQGTSITITGNEYQEIYGKENGMRIDWFLSENMINAFKAAPETPLSSASDIITVTINFVDGTSKTFAIELNFDDEGMLTSIYKA